MYPGTYASLLVGQLLTILEEAEGNMCIHVKYRGLIKNVVPKHCPDRSAILEIIAELIFVLVQIAFESTQEIFKGAGFVILCWIFRG